MSTLRDVNGTPYGSPDGRPAASGTQITIYTPTGGVSGTMVGDTAVRN